MKRPLVWLCIAVAAVLVLRYRAAGGDSVRSLPLREAAALLAPEADGRRNITAVGTVAECRAASSGESLSVDHLTIQRKNQSGQILPPDFNISFTTEYEGLLPGDEIVVTGRPRLFEPATNPGQFDAQAYYFSRNTLCTLTHASVLSVRPGKTGLRGLFCRIRRVLADSYRRILEERQAGVMEAVSLGDKGRLDRDWKRLYQEGGIAHVLAISGLHISLIGMCLYRVMRRLTCPIWLSAWCSGAAVLFYAAMTGFGISAARAAVMFLLWLGAQLAGRKYDLPTAVAVAAAVLIFSDAGSLGQASFLLSFGAILAIAVLPQSLKSVFPALGDAFAAGAGVWLGILPVTLYFYYQAAPWSILINLAVLPLMSALMAYGFLAAAAGLVSVQLGTFLAAPVHYILLFFELLCRCGQKLPAALWVAGRPAAWRILLFYGLLLAAVLGSRKLVADGGTGRRFRRPAAGGNLRLLAARLLWVVCAVLCVCLMGLHSQRTLEITCLDVGQGDGALVRLPGGISCLIDGGSSSESRVWEYRIGQTVRYYGIRQLDYIFVSHADADHISGIVEFLEDYERGFGGENTHGVTLKHLVLPPVQDQADFEELVRLAEKCGTEVLQMEAGMVLRPGAESVGTGEPGAASAGAGEPDTASAGTEGPDAASAGTGEPDAASAGTGGPGSASVRTGESDAAEWSVTCLAPDAASLTGDRNEDSMVLMLRYGSFCMLFTGDLEGQAERRLAASGADLSADILKVGHHGSKGGSSREFLEQVGPTAAVISCGADNPYGHPSAETLERLQDVGSLVFETKKAGAVQISSDGKTYSVETCQKTTEEGAPGDFWPIR